MVAEMTDMHFPFIENQEKYLFANLRSIKIEDDLENAVDVHVI